MDKERKIKDNKAIKKHISAARDWLGRAESSMDKENNLRGDLDVMLAQAELQRAQETKFGHGWRKWLLRLAPLVVAVLVGIGYLAFLHSSRPAEVPANVPKVNEQDTSSKGLEKAQMVEVPPSLEAHESVAPKSADSTESGFVRQEIPAVENVQRVQQPAREAYKPPGEVPDAEMQQLMQAAGKTLRE
ncbi:hypothetical protein D081_0406 [Anaerovibrio sp. JC8]|uniref:hypothetical protein n=1 Tax=Anaerovibrio sp. JC8 TaxID=1240085 RepID=UPI000A0A1025|nr:hypothetical protein [Anaerovibrio sp. JC8]ORU00958.1 hypothetical protein D081_0406 [Anaerovibrio sp. JC8]